MRKQEHPNSFKVPFLTRQLIAYIGNKRRLLAFLAETFERHRRSAGVTEFVDPFAGSGSVARLARLLGYRVAAADCEEYAAVVCRAALTPNRSQADALLDRFGGLERGIRSLNEIGSAAINDRALAPGYIERNYAPRTTEEADYRTERLFYTTENARFLDAVRDTVESWLPPLGGRGPLHEGAGDDDGFSAPRSGTAAEETDRRYTAARALLIAPVLYEASVHANTSGVFKAFHKGFGGHGRDALGRILAPARLEVPELIDGPFAHVEQADAAEFCSRHSGDIVYLDPPYNQHQYGSNYFMLNTIARWDKPPVNDSRASDGSLAEKAGIRADWRETRSDFCYRKSAVSAFRKLLDSVDAGTIVLSYNTEGIVPIEELLDLLAEHGDVRIRSHDYVQYRGGRQSASRRTATAEIAFVVDRGASGHHGNGEHIARSFRVGALCRLTYAPDRVVERFGAVDARRLLPPGGQLVEFEHGLRLSTAPDESGLREVSPDTLIRLEADLQYCVCRDNAEEIEVLLETLDGLVATAGSERADSRPSVIRRNMLEKRALTLLRKLAHPRYRDRFCALYNRFCEDRERAARNAATLGALGETSKARLGLHPAEGKPSGGSLRAFDVDP